MDGRKGDSLICTLLNTTFQSENILFAMHCMTSLEMRIINQIIFARRNVSVNQKIIQRTISSENFMMKKSRFSSRFKKDFHFQPIYRQYSAHNDQAHLIGFYQILSQYFIAKSSIQQMGIALTAVHDSGLSQKQKQLFGGIVRSPYGCVLLMQICVVRKRCIIQINRKCRP